jgi:hypothetical protein
LLLFEISSSLEIDELAVLKQHRFLKRHDFESNDESKQMGKKAAAQKTNIVFLRNSPAAFLDEERCFFRSTVFSSGDHRKHGFSLDSSHP